MAARATDRGPERLVPVTDEPCVRGRLRVSVFRPGVESGNQPSGHVTTFVRSPGYEGMEDNDLRGFLDGRFRWGWNQVSQMHVRVGRESWSAARPKYGEGEIFRVLQRWARLGLPAGTRVTAASLRVTVQVGPPEPVRLLLYAVHKDWEPGVGGVDRNNTSPPRTGEVWWNEAGFMSRPWGLPGVGFASLDHPDADTDPFPLAEVVCQPDQERIAFESETLAAYVQERLDRQAPLLLLIKVSDHQEDIPGALVTLYSANYGDTHDLSRRPSLTIRWECDSEVEAWDGDVWLEYGRSMTFRPVDPAPGDLCALTFETEPGASLPTLYVRSAGGEGEWRLAGTPFRWGDSEPMELRVVAAEQPLALGDLFRATIRDTWIRTGPPEDQHVRWTFRSPTGRLLQKEAEYEGDCRWTVRFEPDELGPWRYRWSNTFTVEPVVALDQAAVLRSLDDLGRRLSATGAAPRGLEPADLHLARVRFTRLERAAMSFEDPASYGGERGRELLEHLDRVRCLLDDRELPKEIPLIPHPPPLPPTGERALWKRRLLKGLRRRISRLRKLGGS